jgi:hypothetical protein
VKLFNSDSFVGVSVPVPKSDPEPAFDNEKLSKDPKIEVPDFPELLDVSNSSIPNPVNGDGFPKMEAAAGEEVPKAGVEGVEGVAEDEEKGEDPND